jgi:predicted GH43/DUF377 family glycosyl hydrolase
MSTRKNEYIFNYLLLRLQELPMHTQHYFSKKLIDRFNAAAWRDKETGHIFLMPREVKRAGEQGEPDKGTLVILELDNAGNIVHEMVVWEPADDNLHLEDPRALVLNDGKVIVGLTAVIKEDGEYVPYPAIIELDAARWKKTLPKPRIFREIGSGKNLTPINANTFFFRKEGSDNSHKLYVLNWDGQNLSPAGEMQFSIDIPWAKWRIGTTMPPIWVNENEALMLIHGIKIENGKYVYSLGRSRLKKQNNQYHIEVDHNPILTPDNFVTDGKATIGELHPELRRVVYSCGGIVKRKDDQDILSLFTNVGDKQTVEVPFHLSHLKQGWW